MLKQEIRKIYLQKRRVLTEEIRSDLSGKICARLIEVLPPGIHAVHSFLPIHKMQEVDTWNFIHSMWEKGVKTYAPVIDTNNKMISRELKPTTRITTNKWNIPEPAAGTYADDSEFDVVVVPLIAFDKNGHRVGYGKGFYDAFLGSLENHPLIIGLSLFPPVDKIADLGKHDVPMHLCISPDQVFKF